MRYIKEAINLQINPSYGYLWWLNCVHRVMKVAESVSFAGGAFGQYAFVLLEKNMVIVTMGFNRESSPSQDSNMIWDLLATTLPDN